MKKPMKEYSTQIENQQVNVKVGKPKEKVHRKNKKRLSTVCPECGSKLTLNEVGAFQCTGSMLKIWENLFSRYHEANEEKKLEILEKISDTAKFEELYWRWSASIEENGEKFNCGYTNKLYPPVASNKSRIPDPIFVKILEKKLGRKLTETEIIGEDPIWFYRGQFITKFRKGASKVRIPVVTLPDDVLSEKGL